MSGQVVSRFAKTTKATSICKNTQYSYCRQLCIPPWLICFRVPVSDANAGLVLTGRSPCDAVVGWEPDLALECRHDIHKSPVAAQGWLRAARATRVRSPHAASAQFFDPLRWFFVRRSGSIRECQPDNRAGLTPTLFFPRESPPS